VSGGAGWFKNWLIVGTRRGGVQTERGGRRGDATRRRAPLDPLERPVRLLSDARDVLHRFEEVLLLRGVLDVRVDEERVHLCRRERGRRRRRKR